MTITNGMEPHAAVSKVVQYMREHDMTEMLVDDENKIPSYARVPEMFEDEELDYAVAWLPMGVGLIENSTCGGGWNPHVRLATLEGWLSTHSAPVLVPVRVGILLTRNQIEAWASRPLSDEDVARLGNAIPLSSIPDAVDTIVSSWDD